MKTQFLATFKSRYRRHAIARFILTVGMVDAVIGGIGQHWSLLGLGGLLFTGAIALPWLQHSSPARLSRQRRLIALPPSPSKPL